MTGASSSTRAVDRARADRIYYTLAALLGAVVIVYFAVVPLVGANLAFHFYLMLWITMASGFNADRRNFCPFTRDALQTAGTVKYFNSNADGLGNGAAALKNSTYCPDPASADIATDGPIGKVAQKVYPNMLFGALIRGPFIYVNNVGAQPEPPVNFNTNVQALVGVLSAVSKTESPFSVNLVCFVTPW